MAYQVTAPLVVAKRTDGRYEHVYDGGLLSAEVDPDHITQLLDQKMIEEAPDPEPTEGDESPRRGRKPTEG